MSMSEMTPLENPVICKEIFSHLNLPDLKSVRQVCKLWKRIGTDEFQQKGIINITWTSPDTKSSPTIFEFLFYLDQKRNCSDNDKVVPYRHYKLIDWCFCSREDDKQIQKLKQVKEIFKRCGQFMESLTFSRMQVSDYHLLRQILFHWTPNLHTLKFDGSCLRDELVGDLTDGNVSSSSEAGCARYLDGTPVNLKLVDLVYEPTEWFGGYGLIPFTWDEIFVAFPNIQNLDLRGGLLQYGSDSVAKVEQLLHALKQHTMKLKEIHGLFSLDIPGAKLESYEPADFFRDHHYKLFSQISLTSLHSVTMETNYWVDPSLVRVVLKELAPRLKRLGLLVAFVNPHQNSAIFPVPYTAFPKLIALDCSVFLLPDSFDFLRAMPSLKSLSITSVKPQWGGDGNCAKESGKIYSLLSNSLGLKWPSLESLHIPNRQRMFSASEVEKIQELFPSLIDFGAVLDDSGIQQVYSAFPNLEKLEIKCFEDCSECDISLGEANNQITDFGITGIGPSQQIGRCISELKRLEHLLISNYRLSRKLTDESIYHGLLHLESLKTVQIESMDKLQISSEAFQKLCVKYHLLKDCSIRCKNTLQATRR